jgi:hypothetical protein
MPASSSANVSEIRQLDTNASLCKVLGHIRDRNDITSKDKNFARLSFFNDLIITGITTSYWIGCFLELFPRFQSSHKVLHLLSAPAFYTGLALGFIATIGFAYATFLLNIKEAHDEEASYYHYSNWRKLFFLLGSTLTMIVTFADVDFVILLFHPNLQSQTKIYIHLTFLFISLLFSVADIRALNTVMTKQPTKKTEKQEEENNPSLLKELYNDPWSTFGAIGNTIFGWLGTTFVIADFFDPLHTFANNSISNTIKYSSVKWGMGLGFFLAATDTYCHYKINHGNNGKNENTQRNKTLTTAQKGYNEAIAFVHYLSDILEVMTGVLLCYEIAFGINTNKLPIYLFGCILGAIFSLAPYNTSRGAIGGLNKTNLPFWGAFTLIIIPSITAFGGLYLEDLNVPINNIDLSPLHGYTAMQRGAIIGATIGLFLGLCILIPYLIHEISIRSTNSKNTALTPGEDQPNEPVVVATTSYGCF